MRRDHPLVLGALVTLLCGSALLLADPPPTWWTDTTNGTAIINPSATPNNYGVLNLGQLKFTAYQARNYLNQQFGPAGGAGAAIDALVANFTANTSTNFAPATLGQLEYVAKPFYDRLNFLGFDTKSSLELHGYTDAFWTNPTQTIAPFYPWHLPPGSGDAGYTDWQNQLLSLVNLGQLKMAFSFDLSNYHAANDNLLGFYAWANFFGLNITQANLSTQTHTFTVDGLSFTDNVTYWNKYRADESPDVYIYAANIAANLVLTVAPTSNHQSGNANSTLPYPIVLNVTSNGSPLYNVPIHYVVLPGDGSVSYNGSNVASSGILYTNSTTGNITLNYTMGNTSALQWIHFTAPSTNAFADAIFTLTQNGSNNSTGNASVTPGIGNYYGNGTLATIVLGSTPTDASVFTFGGLAGNLEVTPNSSNVSNVTLTWDIAGDNSGIRYSIQRKTGIEDTWNEIGSVTGGAQSFTDNAGDIYGGYRYLYQVVAYYGDAFLGTSGIKAYNVPLIQSFDYHIKFVSYNNWADTGHDYGWAHFLPPDYGVVTIESTESDPGYPDPGNIGYTDGTAEYKFTHAPIDPSQPPPTITWYTTNNNSGYTLNNCTANTSSNADQTAQPFKLTPPENQGLYEVFIEPTPDVYDDCGLISQAELSGNIPMNGSITFRPHMMGDSGGQHIYAQDSEDQNFDPVHHVVVSWSGINGANPETLLLFGIIDANGTWGNLTNGSPIYNSMQDGEIWDDFTQYAIIPSAPSAPQGALFQVTIDYYADADGNVSLGSKTFTLENVAADNVNSFSSSTDEIAGAEYRKVALNGRPLPDGKPQTASESDQQEEETFVDALTLGLRHSVSDIYETIPGADMPLTVNRVYSEETWSDRNGLRPHERPDQPFGPGWRSNLVASVRWESATNNIHPNVYVTDENGNEYHFLAVWHGNSFNSCTFVPYPTGKHEKKPYEASLTMVSSTGNTAASSEAQKLSTANLTLKKKFGSTVNYEHADLDDVYAEILTDRLLGSSTSYAYHYFRATNVTGRGEVGSLTYTYPVDNTLVPETITGTGSNTTSGGNLTIVISQDEFGHVRKVMDSDNNVTQYSYSSATDATDGSTFYQLTTVTDPTNATVNYTYATLTENDTTPSQSGDLRGCFYHQNLTELEDQNHNTYHFAYQYSYNNSTTNPIGFMSFNSLEGDYKTPGRPLMMANISLTNGNTSIPLSQYENDSFVEVGNEQLHLGSRRHTVVTDAEGNVTDYSWSSPKLMMQDIPSVIADESLNFLGELVAWDNLTVTYKDGNTTLGSESYVFDPAAGMALMSATDFSHNKTSFTHGDTWSAPQEYLDVLPGVYDTSHNGLFGYWDDPTSQQRFATVNGTANQSIIKNFTYNTTTRLMTNITDEEGNLTHYDFDGNNTVPSRGLRISEKHYDRNSTLVAETDYAYGNAAFPGVVTDKTARELNSSHLAGPGDLTVHYVLDANGHVQEEHTDYGGLDLTTSYVYSAAGDKLHETDPNGHTTYFNYDGRHRLTSVTYPDNTFRTYAYDGRGNVLTETDELSHETIKTYDEQNRLQTVTRVMDGVNELGGSSGNITTTYGYSNTSARTSVTDPRGATTTYTYDGLNRLTVIETPEVGIAVVNATNNTVTTSPGPLVTQYSYDIGSNPGGNAFDSSSFKPTRIVDPRGYTTTVVYDERYLPITQSVQYGADTSVAANTTMTYDAVGNLRTVTDPLGHVTTTTCDALNRPVRTDYADGSNVTANYTSTGFAWKSTDELGRSTQKMFDGAGRVVKVIAPDSSNTTTQYDANGNAIHVTDALGRTWDYVYDERNRKVSSIAPGVEDWSDAGSGNFISPTVLTQYDAVGNPTSVTDARGFTTTTLYDAANRPTFTFTPTVSYLSGNTSGNGALVTAREYDANGNVLKVHQGTASSLSPSGASFDRITANNTYDALNRLITTTNAADIMASYYYDEVGNKVAVVDGAGLAYKFFYDGLNRPLMEATPGWSDIGFTVHVYNAVNAVTEAYIAQPGDDLVCAKNYTYDQRNRLLGLEYVGVAGSTISSSNPATTPATCNYTYDAAGRLLAVKESLLDANLTMSNIAYAYDSMGRVVKEAQGVTINGTVSANGTNLPNGVSGGFVNSYTYDAAGNRLSAVYGAGRSDAREVDSEYDNLNRLRLMTENLVGAGDAERQTYYHYDAAGNRVYLIQPNYGYIDTDYDALGRQMEVRGATPGNATQYDYTLAYDEFGNLKQQDENYPAGQIGNRTVSLGYDGANRLTSEALAIGFNTYTTAYGYDASNNRSSKNITKTFNNTTTTLESHTYDYQGNLLISSDSISFRWGLGGRLFEVDGPWDSDVCLFDYDFDGQLLHQAALSADSTAKLGRDTYAYDYRGRQVWREQNVVQPWSSNTSYWGTVSDTVTTELFSGGTGIREYAMNATYNAMWVDAGTNFTWQNWGNLSVPAQWTPANTTLLPSAEYIRGSDWGGGVGGVLYSLHGPANGEHTSYSPHVTYTTAGTRDESLVTANFYHYDARGDVVAQTTGSAGSLVYQAAYNAFGQHSPSTPSTPSPWQFAAAAPGTEEWTASGAQTDTLRKNTKQESDWGGVNEGQRYFIPNLGTFLQQDPLGPLGPDGSDVTSYCRQNPWTNFDPEGLMTEDDYDRDQNTARNIARSNEQGYWRAYQHGDYGDPNSKEALNKFNTLSQEEEANRDQRIANDKAGKANIEATAKWGREHGMAVNEGALDDDPGHSSSMGPSLETVLGVSENGVPTAGQSQYASLRGQMTSSDMKEVAKQAAILGVTDGAGKLLEGAGEALAALKGGSAEEEAIAGKLTGYTKHGINSAISHDGVGVSPKAILDAIKNPGSMVKQADGAVKYVGKDATVILNQDGKVITTWANSATGVRAP